MPYASLRDFIARLETAGQLVRVTEPVSPHLEMTEIQTRLLGRGRPGGAVRERRRAPTASARHAVLVNLFGTVKRVAWGMDREPRRSCARSARLLAFLRQPEPPRG